MNSFAESHKYFPTLERELQFYNNYSRYSHELGRRETWVETVDRTVSYLRELSGNKLPAIWYTLMSSLILSMDVMPSMRTLAQSGTAQRSNGIQGYNCAYHPMDHWYTLVEALMISMSGCGFGFSVEREYTNLWPVVPHQKPDRLRRVYAVKDSTEGWAVALRLALKAWLEDGEDILFDTSQVRPAGSVLYTKGGRASGPEPLERMLDSLRTIVLSNQGKRLRPIDIYDMTCMVGDCAVSGGKRRTAMICLFDLDDREMMTAKPKDFWLTKPWRGNSNNSAVWPSSISKDLIAEQIRFCVENETGEPGFFVRDNAVANRPEGRRPEAFGTNPCGEIVLRPGQFCNLSSIVARPEDDLPQLMLKAQIATMIGMCQSVEQNFPMLRDHWVQNAEEERLLGVDLNNHASSPLARTPGVQARLRRVVHDTIRNYAPILGIAKSPAATCVKPSGNSALLLGAASGVHDWWAPYFIRRVTLQESNPVTRAVLASGYQLRQSPYSKTAWLAELPMKAPEGAITQGQRSAIDQCEYALQVNTYWADHNTSVSITYDESEADGLVDWLYAHRTQINGMAFFPKSKHNLPLPPYEEIDKETYERMVADQRSVDFSMVTLFEKEDMSSAASTAACEGPACAVA